MDRRSKSVDNTEQQENGGGVTRRNFLRMGIGALGLLALGETATASLMFMQPRQTPGSFGSVIDAGAVDDFPAGSVVQFPEGRFYLVRAADGGFLALYSRCTHLGCSVQWEAGEGAFVCPCHASSFDQLGNVHNPPAPRPLDTFPVSIAEGRVLVDTSRHQTRAAVDAADLVYA